MQLQFFFGGCYYHKADLVSPPPTSTCDTTNITYSKDVTAIINANCIACHGGDAALSGGVVLDTYPGLLIYANSGDLLNNIEQNPGSDPMPKGGAKLSDCDINIIRAWINNGAPNN